MITLYGIPNCDTMKKARKWLDRHEVDYTFHNYKKDGIDKSTLKQWSKSAGWDTLINRRGTTWRQLPENTRNNIDEATALKAMEQNPSLIKRPVLDTGEELIVGFTEDQYADIF